jgi:hypothetical protein
MTIRSICIQVYNGNIAKHPLINLSCDTAAFRYYTNRPPKIQLPRNIHFVECSFDDLNMPVSLACIPQNAFYSVMAGVPRSGYKTQNRFHVRISFRSFLDAAAVATVSGSS